MIAAMVTQDRWHLAQIICGSKVVAVKPTILPNPVVTFNAVSRKIFDIIGQNPSVSNSNQLHVVIFSVFLYWFEVYSIDSPTNR